MTEAEKQEIVDLVMAKIDSKGVEFDIETDTPQSNDLINVVRKNADGTYEGLSISWNYISRIETELTNIETELTTIKNKILTLEASSLVGYDE